MTTRNVGDFDRAIRVLVGFAVLTFVKGSLAALGLIPVLSGLMGFCPVYRMFGFSTRAAPPTRTARPSPFTVPVRTLSTRTAPALLTRANVQDVRFRRQPLRRR